jgi:hypothetical protein
MVVAMVVATVVAVGWYYLARPNQATQPVPVITTAEWGTWVTAGRDDHKLVTMAPSALPAGWRATSATYVTGVAPHWHLGMLTGTNKYVGIEEALDPTDDLIRQFVDDNAVRGADATVGGQTWQVWTDSGGDYALIRTLTPPHGGQERLLVYGSAPDAQVRAFAATLSATAHPATTSNPLG